MKEYRYYWFHHMMPEEQRQAIQRAIDEKDYEAFIELYKHYAVEAIKHGHYVEEFETWFPMTYLPDGISVWDAETEEFLDTEYVLSKPSFMKITYSESECG